ncbi:hypothetical protein HNP25_002551 [Arcicella rosea]|uniref:Uncharacterized protein n=1 Tax=Arcicella rosea TaxID=502909 RepID=A0A841EK21_9BACT|nr:hypothetical protein [Arcicella rosea]
MINDLSTWHIFCNLFYILFILFLIDFLGIRQLFSFNKKTLISQCVNELVKRNIQFTYDSKGLMNIYCVIHNEEFYDGSIPFRFFFIDENQVKINYKVDSSNHIISKTITDFKELLEFKPFTI